MCESLLRISSPTLSLPPFNRGINGAAPIRSNRSAINQRPRNGNVRNEPRLPLRYVRADQTRRKQTARGSFDIVLSNWETKLPTPDHRARVITRLIDVHLLLSPRAKSPPPERSVISHRSRHHFGLISKLRFVIYNGHVYSRAPYLAGFIIFSTMPITPIVDQPIYLRFDPANTRIQPDKSAAPTKFSRFHRIHGFILDA